VPDRPRALLLEGEAGKARQLCGWRRSERLKIVGAGRCRPGRPRVSQGCPMQRLPILSVPLSMGPGG
jgi:hypothetical protein